MDDFLRWIMPGLPKEEPVETLKHLPGKHNQKRHGWRYGGVNAARRSMRGEKNPEERDEYRRRAGMKPIREKRPEALDETESYRRNSYTTRSARSAEREAIEYLADETGMSVKEAEAYWNSAVKDFAEVCREGDLRIRINEDTFREILNDGDRLKSQFETNTSNGYLDIDYRADVENYVFGAPHAMNPENRPIYGYLYHPDAPYGMVRNYGDVAIQLHPKVKKRTTVTFGDSLDNNRDGNIFASPLLKADGLSMDGDAAYALYDYFGGGKYPDRSWMGHAPYIEIQVHGQVRQSDFAKVIFSFDDPPAESILRKLDSLGIEYEFSAFDY